MSISTELQSTTLDNSAQAHPQPCIVAEHGEATKRPRTAKNIDCKGPETVSPHVASNEKENGNQLSGQNLSGKDLDVKCPQLVTVEGDDPANCQSLENGVDAGQNNPRRGAKRRKSGSVRRFTQDMTSLSIDYFANAPLNISSCDRAEELMLGNSNAYRKKKFDGSRNTSVITRLIKPISYSASVTNNVQDVSVTFVAMRYAKLLPYELSLWKRLLFSEFSHV